MARSNDCLVIGKCSNRLLGDRSQGTAMTAESFVICQILGVYSLLQVQVYCTVSGKSIYVPGTIVPVLCIQNVFDGVDMCWYNTSTGSSSKINGK